MATYNPNIGLANLTPYQTQVLNALGYTQGTDYDTGATSWIDHFGNDGGSPQTVRTPGDMSLDDYFSNQLGGLQGLDSQGRVRHGSIGYIDPLQRRSWMENATSAWQSPYTTDPSVHDAFEDQISQNGKNYWRGGAGMGGSTYDELMQDELWSKLMAANGVTANDFIYDDKYGNMAEQNDRTTNAMKQYSELMDKKRNGPLNDSLIGFLSALGMFAGPIIGAASGAAGAGMGAAGSAFPSAAVEGVGSGVGAGAAAGGAAGSVPASYWNTLADAGGTTTDVTAPTLGSNGFDFARTYGSTGMDLADYFGQGASFNPLDTIGTGADSFYTGATGGTTFGGSALNPEMASSFTDSIKSLFATGQGAPIVQQLTQKVGEQAAKTLLGRLLNGEATGDDLSRLLGTLGSTGLGVLGANNQVNAFRDMQNQYLALGAPYRDRLNASYQPGFDLTQQDPAFKGALDQASQSLMRALSVNGNPYDNPGTQIEANKQILNGVALPQLNTYRSQLGSFGQLGVNTAGTAGLGAASNAGGAYDALGYGLGQATQPQNDFSSLLKALSGAKLYNNVGF